MDSSERERITHPAFGHIVFHRTNGISRFYGSELEQQNYITLEILDSEIERDLTCDRFFAGRKTILKARLSANQFSELITSLNTGSGVPCTLEYVNNTKVEKLPEIENRKELVHRKFKDRMTAFSKTLVEKQKRIKELTAKKTLSKDDQKEIESLTSWVIQETSSNIPFFAECFQETCDEVLQDAKSEMENAIQHKITMLGLKALGESNKHSEIGE